MKLLIVESPTKTKSISKYLGKGYEVLATMGHVRDLPKSKMGVEIAKKVKKYTFEPEYIQVKGKASQVKSLVTAAKKASEIILATDPDREGEAIAWHTEQVISDKVKGIGKKFVRVVFHSITKEAVAEAMKHPHKLDMKLVNAQQARRILDRVVGYRLSPVLWRKVRRGLSAGRVQSVAVRLVVERELEIEKFKPEEYWEIKVEVGGKGKFLLDLTKIDGKKAVIADGKKAAEVVSDLGKSSYEVLDVIRKERKAWPHPPFKTSTMQQAASNVMGWSAKKTMMMAQKLYEKGLITYHRTDSLNLVSSALDEIRGEIVSKFGKAYLPDSAKFYKTGKAKVVAQEAHEAIRPTHISDGADKIVDPSEKKLYQLIWRRTISSQMKEAIVDQTKIVVSALPKYELAVVGEIVKFDGFRRAYGGGGEDVILPEVVKGDSLDFVRVLDTQKFTQPPARFNDASLIRELEKRGIGRPSTYAATIATIIMRGYVERRERKFFATDIGKVVVKFLMANFAREMDYEFTAKMEADLDEIADGSKKWEDVLSDFWIDFEPTVEKVIKDAKRVEIPVEKTGEKCPDCKEGEIIIRTGRFGRFLSCDKFPECKYTAPLIVYAKDFMCEKCGSRMTVRKTRKGRQFYGCEKYPKCDFASWKLPKPGSSNGAKKVIKKTETKPKGKKK
jgi:DNA topoisomerase I